jgi:WD40 repeat protein
VWDALKAAELATLKEHHFPVYACVFSPDGIVFGSASGDHTIKIWETNRAPAPSLPLQVEAKQDDFLSRFDAFMAKRNTTKTIWMLNDWFINCAFSSDGIRLATASSEHKLQLWDLPDVTLLYELLGLGEIVTLAWKPSGEGLAVGSSVGDVYLLELKHMDVSEPRATAVVLFRPDRDEFDQEPSAQCCWCGQRFVPSAIVLDAIRGITEEADITFDDSPCAELEREAWDEPLLLTECSLCHRPLRFNPFIVDNHD